MDKDEPIVILEERRGVRRLRLRVGPAEASAIILELEGIPSPRPLPYELLADFFAEGGFCLDRVELFGDSSEAARARLAYRRGTRGYEKEVRPSDALALALTLRAPVFASETLLDGPAAELIEWKPRVLDFVDWKSGRMRA